MTLQEILKSQGLTDEQVQAVVGEMKQNKIFTVNEENLDTRYKDLQTKFDSKSKEHKEATALIEQLKKDNSDNGSLTAKISEYEATIEALNEQLTQTKIESAVRIGLQSEKAVDIDYLTFKLKEKGEKLELDEQGNIKGWADKISALKTQLPMYFDNTKAGGTYDGMRPLEKGADNSNQTLTRSDILKKPYAERIKLFNENPENYNAIMKG